MKRALLINEGYSDNLGDQAIRYTIEKLLNTKGYDIEFLDFTRLKKVSEKKDVIVDKDQRNKLRKLIKLIIPNFLYNFIYRIVWLIKNFKQLYAYCIKSEYDLVVIGGGQLILSNVLFPIAMFTWVNMLKYNKKSKLVLFGVGCGNKFSKLDYFLYKNSLNKFDRIFIRDNDSIKFLSEKFGIESEYVPDPVFYIDELYMNCLNKDNVALVGIVDFNIYKRYNKNNKSEEEYVEWWENKVIHYLKQGYDVKLFYTSDEDIEQTNKLNEELITKYNIKTEVLNIKTLETLLDLISSSQIVVSSRMHALIIAYAYKCKIDTFVISKKILSFKNHYMQNYRGNELKGMILNAVNRVTNIQ